jgi:membrane-associated protein
VVPVIAGMSEMNIRQFIIYNILGGVLWTSSLLLAGVWLGQVVWIREHFSLLVAGIIVVSLVPVLLPFRPWSHK